MKTTHPYITIAWLDTDIRILDPGQPDIGISPTIEQISVPKAVVWLAGNATAEINRARMYANTLRKEYDCVEVYVYSDEPNPLKAAKAAIAQATGQKEE